MDDNFTLPSLWVAVGVGDGMTQTDLIALEASKREGTFSSEDFHEFAKRNKVKLCNVTTILRRLHTIKLLEAVGSVPQKKGGNDVVIYQKVAGANFAQKPKAPAVMSSYFVRDAKVSMVNECFGRLDAALNNAWRQHD